MPPHHGVRVDENQGVTPIPPSVSEQDPEESVTGAKLRAFAGAPQDGQLLTKREVLKGNGLVTEAGQAVCSKETTNAVSMSYPAADAATDSTSRAADPVLAKDIHFKSRKANEMCRTGQKLGRRG